MQCQNYVSLVYLHYMFWSHCKWQWAWWFSSDTSTLQTSITQYNEQTNAHLIDSLLYCFLFLTPTCFKTAWTRLCDLAGTEWELPEDDVLALEYVGAINKEQYNKNYERYQLDATIVIYYHKYLYMFRASICPSSGVQVVYCCIWCSALGVVAVVLRSRCVVLCTVCKFVSRYKLTHSAQDHTPDP
jgi:hypothetical protein